MNDKTANKLKARIMRLADKWRAAGFGWWKITFEWNRGSGEEYEGGNCSAATCSNTWQYRMATITFNLGSLIDKTDDELEEIVVHELSHLLVGSIQNYSTENDRQMTEFAVTNVATALLWTASHIKRSKT